VPGTFEDGIADIDNIADLIAVAFVISLSLNRCPMLS